MITAKPLVRAARDVPGTSLLPVPFAISAVVLVLLAFTLSIDTLVHTGRVTLPRWLSVGNIDDARVILGAILASVSTVLALIFSVTLLVFSMAVNQFGPRLMPHFLRERAMQVALGLFLATFLYSLLTFVVTGQHGDKAFVPQLSLLTSVALVLFSFCYLVVYNHRIAVVIQTNNVLAHIVEDLYRAIGEAMRGQSPGTGLGAQGHPEGGSDVDQLWLQCLAEGEPLQATTSGYVQTLDYSRLVTAATDLDAVVCLAFRPGEFVLEGETMAHVLPASCAGKLAATIRGSVTIGQHRTLEQDVEFAFAQLSEIAIRALSPSINDTYTGLTSIDWLGDALRMFATSALSEGAWRGGSGQLRLLLPPLRFARVVHAAFDLIRDAGAQHPAVTVRLLQTCARLAMQLNEAEQRSALYDEVEAAYESALKAATARLDRRAIEQAYALACSRLKMAGPEGAPSMSEPSVASLQPIA